MTAEITLIFIFFGSVDQEVEIMQKVRRMRITLGMALRKSSKELLRKRAE